MQAWIKFHVDSLMEKGVSIVIENGACKLLDKKCSGDQMGFSRCRRSDKPYVLQRKVSTPSEKLLFTQKKQQKSYEKGLQLWQRRLAHISNARIKMMENERALGINLNLVPETIDCLPFVETKQTKSRSDGILA